MEFLRKETEGLPPQLVEVALAELESLVRQARGAIHYDTSPDLRCLVLCGKIGAVLDLLQRHRKALEPKES